MTRHSDIISSIYVVLTQDNTHNTTLPFATFAPSPRQLEGPLSRSSAPSLLDRRALQRRYQLQLAISGFVDHVTRYLGLVLFFSFSFSFSFSSCGWWSSPRPPTLDRSRLPIRAAKPPETRFIATGIAGSPSSMVLPPLQQGASVPPPLSSPRAWALLPLSGQERGRLLAPPSSPQLGLARLWPPLSGPALRSFSLLPSPSLSLVRQPPPQQPVLAPPSSPQLWLARLWPLSGRLFGLFSSSLSFSFSG